MNEIKPGRELDALVAEKVMGYARKRDDCNTYWVDADGFEPSHSHDYSTDIAAAWELLDTISRREHLTTSYSVQFDDKSGKFLVIIQDWYRSSGMMKGSYPSEYTDTAPHAICLAALRACGMDIG